MCKKPLPGKYYSVKVKPDLKTLMCMIKGGSNVYDVDPSNFNLVHVGDSTKEEVLSRERLVMKGKKVLVVEGVPHGPSCGVFGKPPC